MTAPLSPTSAFPSALTMEEFDDRFDITDTTEDYATALAWSQATPQQVWTCLNVDGVEFIVPGLHYVNRVNHCATRVPWPNDDFNFRIIFPSDGEGELQC